MRDKADILEQLAEHEGWRGLCLLMSYYPADSKARQVINERNEYVYGQFQQLKSFDRGRPDGDTYYAFVDPGHVSLNWVQQTLLEKGFVEFAMKMKDYVP